MTTQISPLPIQRFYDNNNFPLSGGRLYTYIAGTTTPVATYTDSTGTTANTNPVIMNARGEANVWMTAGQAYKFVLQDASAVMIWTEDNLFSTVGSDFTLGLSSLTDPTKGSALVGFKSPAAGSVGRTVSSKLTDVVNVQDFGAVGDGTTNDTAAFAAAFAAIGTGGGVVNILGSKFYRTDTLTVPAGVVLRGQLYHGDTPIDNVTLPIGQWGAILLNTGATINLRESSGLDSVMVRPYGMTFPQTYSTAWVGTAVTMVNALAYGSFVINTFIVGFAIAITTTGNSRILIDNVNIDCNNGIQLYASYDSCHVSRIHCWPYATQASFWSSGASYAARDKTMLYRSGTGLTIDQGSDDTEIDDCLFYGYLVGASFVNSGGISAGRIWVDHPFGMNRTGNYGIFCGLSSTNVSIETLWIWSVANALVMTANATDQLIVGSLIAHTIDNSVLNVNSGNINISQFWADASVTAISLGSTAPQININTAKFTGITGIVISVPASVDASHIRINTITSDKPSGTVLISGNSMAFTGIASADPINLPASNYEQVLISGTTGFGNLIGGYAGRRITLFFNGALTVSSGSASTNNMRLSGNASFVTASGSTLTLVHDGNSWREIGRCA